MTKDEFIAMVHKDLSDYIDMYSVALELRLLNRKYGMLAKQIYGVPLKAALVESGRFAMMTDQKFRTMVAPL